MFLFLNLISIMGKIKLYMFFLLLIIDCILIGICEGGRYGGGGSRVSHSRPSTSYSRPSPSYSRPSPSYSRPSPSYSHPSPSRPSTNIGWHPSVVSSKTNVHQTNSAPPSAPRGPTNSRPVGWDVNNNNNNKHPSTVGNGPPHPPPNTQTHYPGTNQKPGVTTVHYPGSNNARPATNNVHYPGSGGTNNINRKPATQVHSSYPQPPPPPGPHAPPITSVYNGPKKVKIVNKYYTSNPGYYSLPQPNYHYPGYYHTPTYYHYSSSDTGSGALGFFLGYSLAKMTTPTYSHYSFYDGYRPRYDHYTVVHYHHNKEQAPKEPIIQQNAIVGCVGDSNTVCPQNTTSLCTSDGILMCVVSAIHTQPCNDNRQVNCVTSTVPCVNNTIDGCKDSTTNTTVVNIPCVTTAKVYGNITFVNNTIIVNGTNNTNNTTTTTPEPITTTPTTTTTSTKYPITTTPETITTTTITVGRRKRDTNNNKIFCATNTIIVKDSHNNQITFANNSIIVNGNNKQITCSDNSIIVEGSNNDDIKFTNNTIIIKGTHHEDVKFANNSIIIKGSHNNHITFANNSIIYLDDTTPSPYPFTTTTATVGRRKRDTNNNNNHNHNNEPQQNFCVTVMALPAKKQESEGEKLFKSTKSILTNFIVNAWGLKN